MPSIFADERNLLISGTFLLNLLGKGTVSLTSICFFDVPARSAFDRADQGLDISFLSKVDRLAVGGQHAPFVRADDFLVLQLHAHD